MSAKDSSATLVSNTTTEKDTSSDDLAEKETENNDITKNKTNETNTNENKTNNINHVKLSLSNAHIESVPPTTSAAPLPSPPNLPKSILHRSNSQNESISSIVVSASTSPRLPHASVRYAADTKSSDGPKMTSLVPNNNSLVESTAIKIDESEPTLLTSRFRVDRVWSDEIESRAGKDVEKAELDDIEKRIIKRNIELEETLSSDDDWQLMSFKHFTKEALPRIENYRNQLSVHGWMVRPSLDDIHGVQTTIRSIHHVSCFFRFSHSQYFIFLKIV